MLQILRHTPPMSLPPSLFRRHRFPAEIISHSGVALLPFPLELPRRGRVDGDAGRHTQLRDCKGV